MNPYIVQLIRMSPFGFMFIGFCIGLPVGTVWGDRIREKEDEKEQMDNFLSPDNEEPKK